MLLHRVITAAILLALIAGALFLAPPWVWGLLSLMLMAGAGWEWGRLLGSRRRAGAIVVAIVVPALAWLGWRVAGGAGSAIGMDALAGTGFAILLAATLASWLAVAVPSVLAARLTGTPALLPALAVVSILMLWAALFELRVAGPILVLSAMAIVWCADIGAYFVGRAFGQRKLAPKVSPGKSWEGAWGGLALTVAVALAVAWTGSAQPVLSTALAERAGVAAMVAGLTGIVALSILGDLYESLLKRTAGVKDSGRLLPGHGGILDRIDALVPTMPLCLLIWMMLTPR